MRNHQFQLSQLKLMIATLSVRFANLCHTYLLLLVIKILYKTILEYYVVCYLDKSTRSS
jgi:hypothetical protein